MSLNKRGYLADGIHGALNQTQRDMVMRDFKNGKIDVLVATDFAARGLDISGVTHVYNFDIPQDAEGYVHRIGRTGFNLRDFRKNRASELYRRFNQAKVIRKTMPTSNDALAGVQQSVANNPLGVADKEDVQVYETLAEGLLAEHDSVTLLAAALK